MAPSLDLFFISPRLFVIGVKAEEFLAEVALSCLMKFTFLMAELESLFLSKSSNPLLVILKLSLRTRDVMGLRQTEETFLRSEALEVFEI